MQWNSKVKKIRKTEEIKEQQEDNSSNQDEKKDRDEPIDQENDKEIAGNGDKDDEEISKNSQLIVHGGALLHKDFWFGKTFGDIIRAYQFYAETSFAVCIVGFDKKKFDKDH